MRTKTQEEFIQLIRADIRGTALQEGFAVSDEASLILLAKNHDLTHLVYDALSKNGLPCESRFAMQQYYAAIWRAERMGQALIDIAELFEKEGIDFMPLKGAVIRPMYPESWMRTSADIDILVREEDDLRAADLLKNRLGYTMESDAVSHHRSLIAPHNGPTLELHHALFSGTRLNSRTLQIAEEVWKRSEKKPESEHHYLMTDEMFYFFHLAHMAKHLTGSGGCAVRGIIDLWILDRLKSRNDEARKELLEKGGLLVFRDKMSALADAWMDGKKAPDEDIEQYILTSYMYGSIQRSTAISVSEKGTGKYALQRVFLPYKSLKQSYPILEKHKILTPVYEVVRWAKIFNKEYRTRLGRQTQALVRNKKEDMDKIRSMNSSLGLGEDF